MKTFMPWILGLFVLASVGALDRDESSRPSDLFPSAVGYSLSSLSGVGFAYRYLDSHEGYQLSAVLASNTLLDANHKSLYSFGAAKYWVLYSFGVPPTFFSQLYWLSGGSFKVQSTRVYVDYNHDSTLWARILTVGPGLGVELGLVDHFSLNFEASYDVRYNYGDVPDGQSALSFAPSGAISTLIRF